MWTFRPLPWEYGVRNLFRRRGRSALTLGGLTTVTFLILVVVGFIRGLEGTLAVSGEPDVVLVHSRGTQENIEYSSIAASTGDLLAASLQNMRERYGQRYVSSELYLGTNVARPGLSAPTFGLVRGVTPSVLLVRRRVQITHGRWPGPGEIMVGRLAATKLGWSEEQLAVGREIQLEGRSWKISGQFAAQGATFEAEMWCLLPDLQNAMKRQDVTLVALTLTETQRYGEVSLFCKQQQDLELQATREQEYYALLHQHYGPVRSMAWIVVLLVSGAGIFAGLNTMYGAVAGRVRELATLRAVGYVRRAVALSLVQEAVLLAAGAAILATALALVFLNGLAIRFTMGAFSLRIDSSAVLLGCVTGLILGTLGALPPALRAMRLEIVVGLKAVG